MKKIKDWICKIFGHKIDLVEVTIAKIEAEALNAKDLKREYWCYRCGYRFEIPSTPKPPLR